MCKCLLRCGRAYESAGKGACMIDAYASFCVGTLQTSCRAS